jgi:hypothetical protein
MMPSIAADILWTAPMKDPGPPPIIPILSFLLLILLVFGFFDFYISLFSLYISMVDNEPTIFYK